jgi:hypothetical protein
MPDAIRLQKLLARAGLASRREAEEWIREGRVSVNGRVAQLGDRADPSRDAVKVDGKRLRSARPASTYLLLNKPKGYVTTTDDPERRDTVIGPAYRNLDLSLAKNFRITESARVQFRSEFFNVLNHPNFGIPDGTMGSANLGRITDARDPRILQFALKVIY